ncbi:MAG: RNA methyltransferase [Bacteroidia bacterium]|nr:RNA methyltransferase [Bacteroidia bacterium]
MEKPEGLAPLLHYLSGFISEARQKKFMEVIRWRTRHLTVVLEDIYQPHNASAVLRSCDCFGIQDVHIIENRNKYTINPDVALGSTKWLNLIKYNRTEQNSKEALESLRKKGYRLVATSPHSNDTDIRELHINKPLALIFGTELEGISETVREMADDYVRIPMYGFSESFNISVSAAICLSHLVGKLHRLSGWELTEREKEQVLLEWYRSSIHRCDSIEKDFLERSGQQ